MGDWSWVVALMCPLPLSSQCWAPQSRTQAGGSPLSTALWEMELVLRCSLGSLRALAVALGRMEVCELGGQVIYLFVPALLQSRSLPDDKMEKQLKSQACPRQKGHCDHCRFGHCSAEPPAQGLGQRHWASLPGWWGWDWGWEQCFLGVEVL